MIFPPVRISVLKNDARLKREQLNHSAANMKATLMEFTDPISLIKKHPWLVLGGIGSALATMTTSVRILRKQGWLGKIITLGGSYLVKTFLPMALNGALSLFGNTSKRKR